MAERRSIAAEGGAAPSTSYDAEPNAVRQQICSNPDRRQDQNFSFNNLGAILEKSLEKSLAPLSSAVNSLNKKIAEYEERSKEEEEEGQNDDDNHSTVRPLSTRNIDDIESIDGENQIFEQNADKGEHSRLPMDQVLDNMAASTSASEQTGPSIDPKLANLVKDLLWRRNVDGDKTKAKAETILRPENCEALQPSKVESMIWSLLKPQTRSSDHELQTIQSHLMKSMVLVTEVAEALVQEGNNHLGNAKAEGWLKKLVGAVEMAGMANSEIISKRRKHMKEDLSKDYHSLLSTSVPYTEQMFGGAVNEKLEEIDRMKKASNRVGAYQADRFKPTTRGRGPWNSSRGRGRGNLPFLGQRFNPYNRGRGRAQVGYSPRGYQYHHQNNPVTNKAAPNRKK